MLQGSSSASPQASASNRRKEVHEVNDSLYELYKPEGTPKIQVLFFHGLRPGDSSDAHVSTWKSADDSCIWPQEWLPDFFPGAHIFSVSYSACSRIFDLFLVGENLISDLLQEGIGQITSCPLILVGHCVGGLVIKETCCQAHRNLSSNKAPPNHKEKLGKFLRNIRGVFYYSTPHHGSSGFVNAANGPLFKYFRSLYAEAARLNSEFEELESSYKWLIFGLGASLPIISGRGFWNWLGNILFNHSNEVEVPEGAARQGNHFLIVTADHNSICQPRSRTDKRFYHLKNLIDNIVDKFQVQEECGPSEETRVNEAHEDEDIQQESHLSLAIATTIISNESFYVPIQTSQDSTIEAIEKLGGAHVILIYGGVGKGKSTLARYMYELYGMDGDKCNLFEHVIWLSCANCSIQDARSKQFEVLAEHSPNGLGDTLPQKSLLSNRIAKAFQHFVADKKILIILDDISDPRFLYEMWKVVMGSKHVKYLVTSQKRNVCKSLERDSFCIAMGDPTEEEAKAILASHVGLQGKVIPNQLQDIAKDIIKITEGNPLALACLASHFAYSQNNEDQQAWQDAYKELQELLGSLEVNIVIGNTQSPRSLWAAMRICIESLDTLDAKNLLSLIYACKGEWVPEVVLRVWHDASLKIGRKTSRPPLMKSLEELCMRELVRRNSGTMAAHATDMQGIGQNNNRQWSLRSLVKLYMLQDMVTKGEIRSLIDQLIGNDESSSNLTLGSEGPCEAEEINSDRRRVAIALCALYFDRQHLDSTHAITRAGIASTTADFYDNVHDLRLKAMEPCIWMLDKPIEEGKWTHSDLQCLRKVLLTYICNRQLDDDSISHLLNLDACTQAQLVTLKVLGDICLIEEKPLFSKSKLNFLQAIVGLLHLKEGFPTPVQAEASRTLSRICWKAGEENSTLGIVDTPGVLDFLVSSLVSRQGSDMVRAHAAMALASLAYRQSASIKLRIANQEGVLASLVKLLCAHNNVNAQEGAAYAFQNLTDSADNLLKHRIANEEGAVVGLVKCLALSDHPDLQERIAYTITNLARTDPIRWKIIANEEGALNGLVKLLFADNKPGVQIAAASAMQILSQTEDYYLQLHIAREEGAVAGLVKCLALDDHPDLQKKIAHTLANLAPTDLVRWTIISNEEGALNILVRLLFADHKPGVQTAAARALLKLSDTEDKDLLLSIANEERAVTALVKCLALSDHPWLQQRIAETIANLAHLDPIRGTIANQEGALSGLVKLLFVDEKPKMQTAAARAIANLSCTKDKFLKLRIAEEEAALEGLMKCIIANDHPKMQDYATMALAHLALTKPVQTYFLNQEGALGRLVSLLSAQERPTVQQHAAGIFQNLAATDNNLLKLRIANEEGAIAGLVKCLSVYNCPVSQYPAAWSLCSLAQLGEAKAILQGTEGLLVGLSSLLEGGVHPGTQYIGARALTFINPTKGKEASLTSTHAYRGRADAFIFMRMYMEALPDLDRTVDLLNAAGAEIFSQRCFVKSKLGDLEGALDDANKAVNVSDSNHRRPFALLERGVLKRMMGDLDGALADLDGGLKLKTDDYERLKHRGYVKFLLGDEDGASTDAERAQRIKPARVDRHDYGTTPVLRVSPTEYMGYKLK